MHRHLIRNSRYDSVSRVCVNLPVPSVAHNCSDQATVLLRQIQKLHADSGTAIPQVSNGRGAEDLIAGAR